jgi:hypothetical protein
MNNWCVCFSRIFLLGILVLKGLTARRLYKSFRVKGLILSAIRQESINKFKYHSPREMFY